MINYIEIAKEIESLAVDKGVFFFCILIGVIGVLIFFFGFQFFLIDLDDDLLDKIKSLFLGIVFFFISGIVFGFCWFKIETSKNYHKKEVVEYMKKSGIKETDPEKFIRNVNKVKKFDGVIPEKFILMEDMVEAPIMMLIIMHYSMIITIMLTTEKNFLKV